MEGQDSLERRVVDLSGATREVNRKLSTEFTALSNTHIALKRVLVRQLIPELLTLVMGLQGGQMLSQLRNYARMLVSSENNYNTTDDDDAKVDIPLDLVVRRIFDGPQEVVTIFENCLTESYNSLNRIDANGEITRIFDGAQTVADFIKSVTAVVSRHRRLYSMAKKTYRNSFDQTLELIENSSFLRAGALDHENSHAINDLATRGPALLGAESGSTPKVKVDIAGLLHRFEGLCQEAGSMSAGVATAFFSEYMLLTQVCFFAELTEKLHSHITTLRKEIALFNQAIFAAALRHLASGHTDLLALRAGQTLTSAFEVNDRVVHKKHGEGTILKRSASAKTYSVHFDAHDEPMPRISRCYLTLITNNTA